MSVPFFHKLCLSRFFTGPANVPGSVNGRNYTGHGFDQMQGRGIPPSAVDNAVTTGARSAGRDGATIYNDGQIRVIINPDGSVKTVMPQ